MLCEHFLGGLWNRPFEVGKSHGLFPAKVSKDRQFPATVDLPPIRCKNPLLSGAPTKRFAVDPRSQGESDKPTYGHLPETRARDYKELVDQLGLKEPVLIGWSMGCGELLSYVDQFSEDGIGGLVLVDGLIPAKQNPEIVSVLSQWTNQLQQDRQKEADVAF